MDQKFTAMAMAEVHKAGFFGSLFGGDPATPPPIKAEPLSSYPTDRDAEEAVKSGFGYGSGNEDYIKGEHAQVLGMTDKKGNFNPVSRFDLNRQGWSEDNASSNVDMTKFKNIDTLSKVNDTVTRAALAVNRNPVAAIGFDPRRTILDVSGVPSNAAGSYLNKMKTEGGEEKVDKLWANLTDSKTADASTVVHESIHRGIAKIRESGEAGDLLKKLGVDKEHSSNAEEMLTRYMMYKYAGDPEGTLGKSDAAERQQAINIFEKFSPGMQKNVDALMTLAANQLKNARPGGPR